MALSDEGKPEPTRAATVQSGRSVGVCVCGWLNFLPLMASFLFPHKKWLSFGGPSAAEMIISCATEKLRRNPVPVPLP